MSSYRQLTCFYSRSLAEIFSSEEQMLLFFYVCARAAVALRGKLHVHCGCLACDTLRVLKRFWVCSLFCTCWNSDEKRLPAAPNAARIDAASPEAACRQPAVRVVSAEEGNKNVEFPVYNSAWMKSNTFFFCIAEHYVCFSFIHVYNVACSRTTATVVY